MCKYTYQTLLLSLTSWNFVMQAYHAEELCTQKTCAEGAHYSAALPIHFREIFSATQGSQSIHQQRNQRQSNSHICCSRTDIPTYGRDVGDSGHKRMLSRAARVESDWQKVYLP